MIIITIKNEFRNILNEIFFLASVPSPARNDIAVPKHSVSSAPLNNKYLKKNLYLFSLFNTTY